MTLDAVAVVVGYVLGTLPFAHAVGARLGVDPATAGSGNPGASNVYRTAGRKAGAAVLVGDLLKGAAAAGIGLALGGRELALVCGLAAVLGHVFPVTRRLQGGKGVATTCGVVAVLFPFHALVAGVVWLLIAAVWKLASLASIVAIGGLVIGIAATGAPTHELVVVVLLGAIVLVRHRTNIARLAKGDERPLATGT